MTNPFVPVGQPEDGGTDEHYVGTTLDDIEQRVGVDPTAPTPPDLSVKLDGDNIPEAFRGLTVDQLVQRAAGQIEVIKRMGQGGERQAPPPPVEPPLTPSAPQPLPQIGIDQFREMYDKDPVEALATYGAVTEARMMRLFEDRIQPLLGNNASSAEFQARQQFPDEFKLFEREIKAAASQVPNKAALASPDGWAALVKYVRGDNVDRWIEYKTSQKKGSDPADPQAAAASAALENLTPSPTPSPTNGRPRTSGKGYSGALTEEQRENMKVLGVSEAEYRAHYV